MDEGTIGESEGIHYASNRQTGFLKVMTPARWARACMTCGYIELYLDPRELRQKIGM
jgi:predicted nucleic-acid-binding Zn-ribbon protein